ncbi:hypothetical protein [Nostoc sp.]|uniref:hypothetical protein n=1 Tax=Nostoc sp. TaxID=1180 RepID=UPI002FF6700F
MNCVSTIQYRNLKSKIVSVYTLLRGVRIAIGNSVADSAIAYRSSLTLKLILELILQCSIIWGYLSRNSSPRNALNNDTPASPTTSSLETYCPWLPSNLSRR